MSCRYHTEMVRRRRFMKRFLALPRIDLSKYARSFRVSELDKNPESKFALPGLKAWTTTVEFSNDFVTARAGMMFYSRSMRRKERVKRRRKNPIMNPRRLHG